MMTHNRSGDGLTLTSSIHNLSTADFSDESDSGTSNDKVVMLSWNNGKVDIINSHKQL